MTWWLSTRNSIVPVISITKRGGCYGVVSMRKALLGVCVEVVSLNAKSASDGDSCVDGDSWPSEIFERDRFWVASLHICSESTHAILGGIDECCRERLRAISYEMTM